jgi:hypothetical protein
MSARTVLQDRSLDEKSGTQAFFGNFRTFETLAISKLAKIEGDLDPKQLLDWVMADQRNNVGAHRTLNDTTLHPSTQSRTPGRVAH